MKPKLSVLLPAMKGYETALAALDSWEKQTCRDRIEILVLCPDHLGPTAKQESALPRGQIVVRFPAAAGLHQGRAQAIQRAAGDYVVLAEDHCLPDPDWTQAVLDRLEEGWDGVVSALRPGNRDSCWADGSFLMGYGEWMMPAAGGPTEVLCGWNGTIRTELLRQIGSELAGELLMGMFLVRRLRQQGGRFYLEDRAQMRHFDPPGWAPTMRLVCMVGVGSGAMRTRRWPLPARLLYPLAAPAVAFLHWKRAFVHYRRAGAACEMRPASLAAAAALASTWGVGEAIGALAGTARVTHLMWRTEVKPVDRDVVARSAARERIGV